MEKCLVVLKPFMLMTKEAEGEHTTASTVILMVKKLRSDLDQLNVRGIGTLKDETLSQLDK